MRNIVPEDLLRTGAGQALIRAAFASVTATLQGQQPGDVAKGLWPEDRGAVFLARATTGPAMTNVPGWAQELAQSATAEFLIGLGPYSAASEIFQEVLSLTFDGRGAIRLPTFIADFQNAGFVAEGQAIPVHNLALANPDPLLPHKAAAICVLTRELVESSNAEQLIGDTLKRAAGRMLDEVLFDAESGRSRSSGRTAQGYRGNSAERRD